MAQHGPESKTVGIPDPATPGCAGFTPAICITLPGSTVHLLSPATGSRTRREPGPKKARLARESPLAGLGLRALGSGPGTLRSSSGNARWTSPGGPANAAFEASWGRPLWTQLARPLLRAPFPRPRWDRQGACARGPGPAGGGWRARRERRAGGVSPPSPAPSVSAWPRGASSRASKAGSRGRCGAPAAPGGRGWLPFRGSGPGRAPAPRSRPRGPRPSAGAAAEPARWLRAPRTRPPRAGPGRLPRGRERGGPGGCCREGLPGGAAIRPPQTSRLGPAGRYREACGRGPPTPSPSACEPPHPSTPGPRGRPPGAPGAGAEPGPGAAFPEAAAEIRTRPGGALVAFWRNQAGSSGSSFAPSLTLESSRVCFCHPRSTPILRPVFLPRSRGAEANQTCGK
ncbi:collagen alpha-1(I) chain-like [Lutra lutra]|uniref:collagen alpha-1(I) chain-like n=1 Tax=Lutra lutra TaxID=9657 RepID=UPI001FD2F279|nr:collagen alpha-1(I) chain-like [Lutra lutra]